VRFLFRISLQALTGHAVRVRSILANAWGWRLVRTEVLANGFIKGGHRLLHISEKVLSLTKPPSQLPEHANLEAVRLLVSMVLRGEVRVLS
jgi:hypothetical protein